MSDDRRSSFRRCSTAPQLVDSPPPLSPISHCYYSSFQCTYLWPRLLVQTAVFCGKFCQFILVHQIPWISSEISEFLGCSLHPGICKQTVLSFDQMSMVHFTYRVDLIDWQMMRMSCRRCIHQCRAPVTVTLVTLVTTSTCHSVSLSVSTVHSSLGIHSTFTSSYIGPLTVPLTMNRWSCCLGYGLLVAWPAAWCFWPVPSVCAHVQTCTCSRCRHSPASLLSTSSCNCNKYHTRTHNRLMALCPVLPGWASYQKEHSPTHTHPDHQTSFINFLHLLRSIASSFN